MREQASNDHLDDVLDIVNLLAKKSAGEDYIFRGEPQHYDKVSSSLYREYGQVEEETFQIETVQREILEQARRYTDETDEVEILTQLQHYGGKTNLIDLRRIPSPPCSLPATAPLTRTAGSSCCGKQENLSTTP